MRSDRQALQQSTPVGESLIERGVGADLPIWSCKCAGTLACVVLEDELDLAAPVSLERSGESALPWTDIQGREAETALAVRSKEPDRSAALIRRIRERKGFRRNRRKVWYRLEAGKPMRPAGRLRSISSMALTVRPSTTAVMRMPVRSGPRLLSRISQCPGTGVC